MRNPNVLKIKVYIPVVGLLITRFLMGSFVGFHIINIYTPYLDRKRLWDHVNSGDILDLRSLILADDFNIALEKNEVWGSHCRVDILMGLSKYLKKIR